MFPITPEYNEETNKPLRGETFIEIRFGISDPDAPNSSTFTGSEQLIYSNTNLLDRGVEVSQTYDTLERNRFYLNGIGVLEPEDDYIYQGFVGDLISDDNGNFSTPQYLEVSFDRKFIFAGLSFVFDETRNDYVSDMTISIYSDNSLVETIDSEPNNYRYVVDRDIPECNKIRFGFNKTSTPHRRIRISSLYFGIVDILTDDKIINSTYKNSIDLISTTLPKQSFSFTIFDVDGKYDPENPDSYFKYIENGQSVAVTLKQNIQDSALFKMPICNVYSFGNITTSKAGLVKQITVPCSSILDFLDNEYNGQTYSSTGITVYDLLTNILNDNDLGGLIELDEYLKDYKTYNIINGKSVKNCIQLLCNMTASSLIITRDGTFKIKRYNDNENTDFAYGFNNILDFPKASVIPQIRNIISSYTKIQLNPDGVTEIENIDIANADNTEFTVNYSACNNPQFTTSSGLTLNQIISKSATQAVLNLTGTGRLTINGIEIQTSRINKTYKFSDIGEDLSISNDLINTELDLDKYIQDMYNYYKNKITYTFSDRGFPEMEVNDKVKFQTNYEGITDGILLETELKFNGAISGGGKVLRLG